MIETTLEKIASSMESIVKQLEQIHEVLMAKPENAKTGDSTYPDINDNEGWKKEAEKRGITIPPKTRTTTIIAWVKKHDLEKETPAPVVEPTPEPEPTVEVDPFTVEETPKEELTFESLRTKFQEHMTAHPEDKQACLDIVQKIGKVAKFAEANPATYQAMYDALERLGKGK